MPFLIEHVTEVVVTVILTVLILTTGLCVVAVTRRQRRERYFQRLDELRQRFGPVITAVLTEKIEYARGLSALKSISGLDRDFILEQLCLEKRVTPAQVPILRKLCEDLGLVRGWQRRLTGQIDVASLRDAIARPEGMVERIGRLGFLLRAKGAENLGTILHHESWPLLVRALEDRHPDVRAVALRSLGAIGEQKSFPRLLEQLHAVVLKPASPLSLRAVKAALVNFPLQHAGGLLDTLRHSHPRLRFLATDIIREMVDRQAAMAEDFVLEPELFAPQLAEVFLTELCFDENADVRARAAPVVAYVRDPRATPALLTLLEDSQWFVRLHAVRALAKRQYMPQAAQIAGRLTDAHWMVREGAARTLLVFGRVGTDQLTQHFLGTKDRYSQEQITDEMQRAGLIPVLLAQYASETDAKGGQVIEQLAEMGKTSYMLEVLQSSSERSVRKKFLQDFGRHSDPQIQAWVRILATRETDPELRALAQNAVGRQGN